MTLEEMVQIGQRITETMERAGIADDDDQKVVSRALGLVLGCGMDDQQTVDFLSALVRDLRPLVGAVESAMKAK